MFNFKKLSTSPRNLGRISFQSCFCLGISKNKNLTCSFVFYHKRIRYKSKTNAVRVASIYEGISCFILNAKDSNRNFDQRQI